MRNHLRLGLNIDHVATLRNARGGGHPCPVSAAKIAEKYGVDGITAHLREDRRHIRDEDIKRLKNEVDLPLNLEMAATEEMQKIALEIRPNAVCLVPEKRQELTTEGGLDVAAQISALKTYIAPLKQAGIRISLFIDANIQQLQSAAEVGADIIELHTGQYAEHFLQHSEHGLQHSNAHLQRIKTAAQQSQTLGLECHAGHGLNFENTGSIAAIPEMRELNIGHFLVGEALFTGLPEALRRMREIMDAARA